MIIFFDQIWRFIKYTYWVGWAKKQLHHPNGRGVHGQCNEVHRLPLPPKSRIRPLGTSQEVGLSCFRRQSSLLECDQLWAVLYRPLGAGRCYPKCRYLTLLRKVWEKSVIWMNGFHKEIHTNGSITHECFLVIHHSIDCQFLTVLSCDDGDSGLLRLNNFWHLLNHFNFILVLYHASIWFAVANSLNHPVVLKFCQEWNYFSLFAVRLSTEQ